jgi:metal-responsive CopG/Arc/MetJ family transcriptional regulator
VVKTTVYLPEALKRALERAAETEGLSEAELIRTAVETLLSGRAARRPKLPLYSSGRLLAERVDEELAGFGE